MDWNEWKKLIAAEVSDLVLKFGYEALDKRFLKDHGCLQIVHQTALPGHAELGGKVAADAGDHLHGK